MTADRYAVQPHWQGWCVVDDVNADRKVLTVHDTREDAQQAADRLNQIGRRATSGPTERRSRVGEYESAPAAASTANRGLTHPLAHDETGGLVP